MRLVLRGTVDIEWRKSGTHSAGLARQKHEARNQKVAGRLHHLVRRARHRAGLSVARTCTMSLMVFTGASRCAVVACSAPAAWPPRWRRRCCSPRATPCTAWPWSTLLRGRSAARAVECAADHRRDDRDGAPGRIRSARAARSSRPVSASSSGTVGTLPGPLIGSGLGDPPLRAARDVAGRLPRPARAAGPPSRRAGHANMRPERRGRAGAVRARRRPHARRPDGLVPGVRASAAPPAGGRRDLAVRSWCSRPRPMSSRRSARSSPAARGTLAPDAARPAICVPVLAALMLVQTLDGGGRLVIDARVPAM